MPEYKIPAVYVDGVPAPIVIYARNPGFVKLVHAWEIIATDATILPSKMEDIYADDVCDKHIVTDTELPIWVVRYAAAQTVIPLGVPPLLRKWDMAPEELERFLLREVETFTVRLTTEKNRNIFSEK